MKSIFTTGLDCRLSDDESFWILNQPLIYFSVHLNSIICVPAGFETDFASVPRIPIVHACWGDRAHHESVIHDYLYRIDSNPVVERKDADKVFLEAMKIRGRPKCIRYPMYCGVRVGGFKAYHQKKVRTP